MGKYIEKDKFVKYRNEILDKFGHVESLVDAVISQHYFSGVRREFLLEVLGDEYFSFGLKIRILLKIVKKFDSEKELRELNRIRNYFVHLFPKFHDKDLSLNPGELVAVNPRDTSKTVDFRQEYETFISDESKVRNSLVSTYKKKGGKLVVKGVPYSK